MAGDPPIFIIPRGWQVAGFGTDGPTVVTDESGRRLPWWEVPTLVHETVQGSGRYRYTDNTIRDVNGAVLVDKGAGVPAFLPPGTRWAPVPGRPGYNQATRPDGTVVGGQYTAAELDPSNPASLAALVIGTDPVSGAVKSSLDVRRAGGVGTGDALTIDGELVNHLSGITNEFAGQAAEFGIDPRSNTASDDIQSARVQRWNDEIAGAVHVPDATGGYYVKATPVQSGETWGNPGAGMMVQDASGRVLASSAPPDSLVIQATPPPALWAGTEDAAGSPAPLVHVTSEPVEVNYNGDPLAPSSPGSGFGTTSDPVSGIPVVAPATTAVPAADSFALPQWAMILGGVALLALLTRR